MYVTPCSLRPLETFPALPRSGLLLRPALAFTVIAVLTVTSVLLLGDHGVSPPVPCGESLVLACAAP